MDDVLQLHTIFVNVSKGQEAKADVVERCFGTTDTEAVLKEILRRGELQVGEKEREAALAKARREIATSLASLSVNPTTMHPYPVTMLEKAMREVHFKPDTRRPAKPQALELLAILQGSMPIARAKMRLKVDCSASLWAQLEPLVSALEQRTEREQSLEMVLLIEPGSFRAVNDLVLREGGHLTVVSMAAHGGEAEANVAADARGEVAEKDSSEAVVVEEPAKQPTGDEAKQKEEAEPTRVVKEKTSRRGKKGQVDMNALLGVVDSDDDDDWKSKGATTKGGKKGAKGKKGKGRK